MAGTEVGIDGEVLAIAPSANPSQIAHPKHRQRQKSRFQEDLRQAKPSNNPLIRNCGI
jgi:hypothetical protein